VRVDDADDLAALNDEVASSSVLDRLEVNAWYDGNLVAQHLGVSSWSIDWDDTRQVQGQGTFEFSDPDGLLSPWGLDDPLGVGGARLMVTWISGTSGLEVPLGWFRNRKSDPTDTWRVQPNADGVPVWVPGGGGRVVVNADELSCIPADLDRLDAEPVVEATCLAEVTRLLEDVLPVVVDPAVTDRDIPVGLVYGESRMDAVEDHLDRCSARWRMGPGGELDVVPAGGLEVDWTVQGGSEGVLIGLDRSMSDAGLYNAAISTATPEGGDDTSQLVGRAYLTDGPLAWGPSTPFGRVPMFHQSPAKTQPGVDSDASTLLENRELSGEVELAVECLFHPGVQINDRVTLAPPSLTGEHEIKGRVTKMSVGGTGSVIRKSMTLTVAVTVPDLELLASKARGRG
jgi:hypothetical protein